MDDRFAARYRREVDGYVEVYHGVVGIVDSEDAAKVELAAAIRDFELKARSLQIHLQAEGLYKGKIDGDWGPQSRTALRRYERRKS